MPLRDSAPVGAPCWVDLFSSDPDTSIAFYADVFGWTAEVGGEEYGGYITFFKDGVSVAGGMRNDGSSGAPDGWSVYLASNDAQATCDAAVKHGGQVELPPMPITDIGTMAFVNDPGQGRVGIWQPGVHKGFGVIAEAGAPSWFELHTPAYAAALEFYGAVFGWDVHTAIDEPEMKYATYGEGENALAGIVDVGLPKGTPGQWYVYFGTDDADKTLATIVDRGGAIVDPAEDTPYGRLATANDCTGATFKIVQGQ